ncbi:hypothetical protein C5167_008496 [Papaver somniferum]|uniref:Uncharacterized protein n=1 Tax=Papaver somniferum TaxID=3469 RepID=A0A4Y7JVT6_PAPSO|nr:hypothetical protein C5167_008496 [Papaver somniferum]
MVRRNKRQEIRESLELFDTEESSTIDAKERDVAMTCVLLVLCSLEYYSLNLIHDADTNAEMLDLHGAVVPVGVLGMLLVHNHHRFAYILWIILGAFIL